MIAPVLIICKLLVGVSAQAEGSPTDSALGNFTALFLEREVRNFVDSTIEEVKSFASGRVRSLREDTDVRMLQNDSDYPSCGRCESFYTTEFINAFMRQMNEACRRPRPTDQLLLNEFCTYMELKITSALQFLHGYLLDRSRSLALTAALCVHIGWCPAKALLNKFGKLTNPDRLVDLSNFVYCQHRPDATFSECSEAVLTSMTDVAVRKVSAVCSTENPDGAFEEFCYFYLVHENFGRGMLVSFLSIFSHAAAHCTDRKCSQVEV
ncbi:hypothetical protein FOL47_004833 [Perkinsus chesapeaki]|uniref:Uncharacterized protein n=1 Tax=Perkinsus chesapeaki TaxID=330153 RepID=A0A7J6M0J5_PERCH|nr:hypothetical protein FOL47_004833 [Perkinsus chesapeaki]